MSNRTFEILVWLALAGGLTWVFGAWAVPILFGTLLSGALVWIVSAAVAVFVAIAVVAAFTRNRGD